MKKNDEYIVPKKEQPIIEHICQGREDIRGRDRIFFGTLYGSELKYLSDLANDIWSVRPSAVIFYANPSALNEDTAHEFFDSLKEMNLVVIPYTRLHIEHIKGSGDFFPDFCSDNHIPCIPILLEPGLSDEFYEVGGEIQYIDKFAAKDPTTGSYSDKLKDYFNSILCPEEDRDSIDDAFDSRIFLSYRKKDRKQAQKIMSLIHSDEKNLPMSIWYDEYLVPGENFNEGISDALKNSDIFTLVITPNLVNEDNYVQRIEYPMAQQENKPIIPIVAEKTDNEELLKKYTGLPDAVSADDSEALSQKLHSVSVKSAEKERPEGNRKNCLLGMAYKNGLGVEKNPEIALRLLEKAAKNSSIEATRIIADMYQYGDGVAMDYEKAIHYFSDLVQMLKERFDAYVFPENDSEIFSKDVLEVTDALRILMEEIRTIRTIIGLYSKLNNTKKGFQWCDTLVKETERSVSFIHNRLLPALKTDVQGKNNRSAKDTDLYMQTLSKVVIPLINRTSYLNLISTADLYIKDSSTSKKAVELLKKSYSLTQGYMNSLNELCRMADLLFGSMYDNPFEKAKVEAVLSSGVSLTGISRVLQDQGNKEEALEMLGEAEKLEENLAGINLPPDVLMAFASISDGKGDLYDEGKNATEKMESYVYAADLMKTVVAEDPSYDNREYLFFITRKISRADVDFKTQDGKSTVQIDYSTLGAKIGEELIKESPKPHIIRDTGTLFFSLACFLAEYELDRDVREPLRKALKYFEMAGEDTECIRKYCEYYHIKI